MDIDVLDKYDSSKMYQIYDQWPEIAKTSFFNSDLGLVDYNHIDNIVFAGMGGSGTIGDVISSILSKTNIHVSVVKGYLLPKTVDKNTLVVPISVSGNTRETITILESTQKLDCKLISFSSGGKIIDYCKKNNVDYRVLQQYHSPRASFPSFLFSILRAMQPILPIRDNDINEALRQMATRNTEISSSNLSATNPAMSLAYSITDIPTVYYPSGLQSAAIRFKNSLQENSKIHCVVEDVIEASHNGIVPWEQNSSLIPILLQGADDYIKTKERWSVLKEFFVMHGIQYIDINSVSGGILSKICDLIYLLDYASIFKAVLSRLDPTPIGAIDFVKKRLDQ